MTVGHDPMTVGHGPMTMEYGQMTMEVSYEKWIHMNYCFSCDFDSSITSVVNVTNKTIDLTGGRFRSGTPIVRSRAPGHVTYFIHIG